MNGTIGIWIVLSLIVDDLKNLLPRILCLEEGLVLLFHLTEKIEDEVKTRAVCPTGGS